MTFHELARLGVTFRPLEHWPGERTRGRAASPFSASIGATAELLAVELRALDARRTVLQLDVGEHELRIDGLPRASARPVDPGVVLAFESRHGPLKFAVDTFWTWQDNLRAIALGMEALRKVERYGVTRRGEQYTGWRQLTAGAGDYGMADAGDAREYLRRVWNGDLRQALMKTHPDRGGSVDEFHRVMRAKELLG